MFKALVAGALLFASNALRVEMSHQEIQWNQISNPDNLNDNQRAWDKWFRDALPALGDSKLKEMSFGDNFSAARYFDDTNDHDEEVAWQLQAEGVNKDVDTRRILKVVQTKTASDKDDPNISIVTTTTFNRQNILDRTKQLYS